MKTNVRRIVGLLALFFVWLTCCACISPIEAQTEHPAISALRGFSDAAIRTIGTQALREHAPEAIAILDQPGPNGEAPDGVITLKEVIAVVTASSSEELAERIAWVGVIVFALQQAKR